MISKKKTTCKQAKKPVKKPAVKARVKSPVKPDGLSGRSSLAIRQRALIKAARKDGEKTARKKLLKDITKILKGGKKPKSVAKQLRRIENPFDTRRFRGVRKKKETTEQRLKRVSENIHSTRDQILLGIANGSYKFKWTSVAKECGYKDGERKKMLSILDNKGYTINKLAHKIWEDGSSSYGRGKSDDIIRDEIIDILQTVSSRSEALNLLDRGQGNTPF